MSPRRLTPIALALACAVASAPALANPSDAQVAHGSAVFAQPNAHTLRITNTPGTIINWQHFSIAKGETTQFVQQSAASSVMNRVVGGNISQIYGRLESNGKVYLVNPAGIVIGKDAVVDTAGFVASTLSITDSDFLSGQLKFLAGLSAGSIENYGTIRTADGGRVALLAPDVSNHGLIEAPGGAVTIVAGHSVVFTDSELAGLRFEVQAGDTALNLGNISADNGAVSIFASTLKHSGSIQANRLAMDADGSITLLAAQSLELSANSITQANGANGASGGNITVQTSEGTTRVGGAVSADSEGGLGSTIQILGERVAVEATARVNALSVNGRPLPVNNATGGSVLNLGGTTTPRASSGGAGGALVVNGGLTLSVAGTSGSSHSHVSVGGGNPATASQRPRVLARAASHPAAETSQRELTWTAREFGAEAATQQMLRMNQTRMLSN